jgi:hypothetical protein
MNKGKTPEEIARSIKRCQDAICGKGKASCYRDKIKKTNKNNKNSIYDDLKI